MNDSGTNRPMFDAPLDAWYVWIGLAAASGVALSVASVLPAAPPPDAAGAATVIDSTAASRYPSTGSHPLEATNAIRVGTDSLSLRGPGGTEHAALGYGPVTPAVADDGLREVLRGEPPARIYESPAAFERSLEAARTAVPRWYPTDRLVVRRVSWEGADAVLVG